MRDDRPPDDAPTRVTSGTADSKDSVYGCAGAPNKADTGPRS
ncbi:MAG: hypothetical protein ACI9X0_002022, partial [Kiritimatiellia bacterium]